MRTALKALCALALATLAACSFNRIDGALEVEVTGMPANAIRAEAVLTDANGGTITRDPHFGIGVYLSQPLTLTFPAIPAGNYSVQVIAFDSSATEVGVGNGSGSFTPGIEGAPLGVVLDPSGIQGTYGTPCILTGTGVHSCSGSVLVCKQYSSSDQGVCTHACAAGTSDCETSPPGATCDAFEGVAANHFCQWKCSSTATGSCPQDLICGSSAAPGNGTQRYCQGTN
jgi:hypothetical protein